ncbi:ABC-type Fe3+-hydroxamate transport system, periplasmic component [Lachnospiraceae bacterium JC7]|nr:ABC-type Fe3+-hydroxamate transport system, periplasmic component [Lachnospiraceae bacterium JC7]
MKTKSHFLKKIILSFILLLVLTCCRHKATGDYSPTRFSWSGGSGRVTISCDKVSVTDEGTIAEITFSSPNYDYVRLGDEKISGEHTEKTSTFSVPVELDKEMELIGCTSAMSKPHEISYTIFVSIDDRYSGEGSGYVSGGKNGGNESEQGSGEKHDGNESVGSQSDQSGRVKTEENDSSNIRKQVTDSLSSEEAVAELEAPDIAGLSYLSSMDLDYAKCFAVHYYINESENNETDSTVGINDSKEKSSSSEGKSEYKTGSTYKLISVLDGRKYLLVPEGCDVPGNIPEGFTVLRQPVDDIYLAATSAMSLFDVMGGLSLIKYTGTDISGWDIEAPREAIKSGRMIFAGKYSAPDYEMLIDGGCDIAIESTMILHSPETKEQLEKVGIPVFIDWSSYENSALGRTEWVKLYGAMTDRESEAETFFKNEVRRSGITEGFEKTGRTVAFFYFNSRGLAVVRNSDDYIPKMINDGGGEYVFDSREYRGEGVSMDISMEEFYAAAADADYIIYNGNIDSSVETLQDLVAKNGLLSDFKAVKEGNVYMVDGKFYQSTDTVSEFARDVHIMLSGDSGDMLFLKKLN